jgi:hypothetical protein
MHEINGVPSAELFQEIGSMENVLNGRLHVPWVFEAARDSRSAKANSVMH